MNDITLQMLEMLPVWMKMRSDPEHSQGAKLLNAPGVQLYDIERLIGNILSAHHLEMTTEVDGIDVTGIDVIYKVLVQAETLSDPMEVKGSLSGVLVPLQKADTIYRFYEVDAKEDKYYLDPDTLVLYTKKKFDSVVVNDAVYTDILEHSVWGPFDEIGLLLGCPRVPGERNESYRLRLLDVYQSPGNSTRSGLINFLSRSFGIEKEQVIIQDLSEGFVSSLINSDGTVKAELKEYIILSNKVNLSSSNTYWDVLEESRVGLSYLPIIWNVPLSKWNNDSIQNGVGDEDDLLIIGPEQGEVRQHFDYNVGIEGLRVSKTQVYPEHTFKYRLYATGQKYDDGYSPENYRYSVIASELIPLEFKVKAHKRYTKTTVFDFSTPCVDYTAVTDGDKKLTSYVLKNVVIKNGNEVMNPNNRYIEILANLSTANRAVTPSVDSITLTYHVGSTEKTIVIDNQSTISQGGNTITAGFTSNTWNDASPILRIRNDTNDNYNVLTPANGTLSLAHGEYQKVYNSEGDWDDGSAVNLRTTSSGTLKLSI